LIYATCSLLREENEEQIANFLGANPEFEAQPFELSDELMAQNDQFLLNKHEFRTFPGLSQSDGFYAACLRRKED